MRIRWRNFELPNRVTIDEGTREETYGRFHAEPFERGFGTTVGNGLRRILLGSLEGTAVTHVKIHGVQHEFTSMDGVVEDVTEVILNLKRLLVRLDNERSVTLTLEANKEGDVLAGQFKGPHFAEVVNKDLKVLTLAKNRDLSMEVTVRTGRGYRTAEENASEDDEIGIIPIDSIFSPVQRVRYKTENTRVGKMTNYDRLVLELWTDGTVSPESALVEASKIFRKHLNPFIQYFEIGAELPETERKGAQEVLAEREQAELKEKYLTPISELDLSVRAANCMEVEGIETIGDLVGMPEEKLLEVRNFGKTSLKEITKKLGERGLTLGMDVASVLGEG
ncbi:MAG: DNA-directed RNA polymerase subunit alpha [Planctomycetota bacterium]